MNFSLFGFDRCFCAVDALFAWRVQRSAEIRDRPRVFQAQIEHETLVRLNQSLRPG